MQTKREQKLIKLQSKNCDGNNAAQNGESVTLFLQWKCIYDVDIQHTAHDRTDFIYRTATDKQNNTNTFYRRVLSHHY